MIESSLYADDSSYDKARAAAHSGISLLSDKYPTSVHAQLANLLHMSNGKDEAYKLINSLSTAYPGDSAIQTTHYSMLLRDKKNSDALAVLNALVTEYPSEKRLRKERSFLYEDMNRHGDACGDAVKLAEEDDDYFPLLLKLGCPQAFANIAPGLVASYTYDVDYHGTKYQFIVKPTSINMDAGVSFKWKMTIRDDMQGTISISKAALDTAHGQMNKFSAGNSDLKSLTSVWVSRAVYKELKQKGRAVIEAGESGPRSFVVLTEDNEPTTITNAQGKTRALNTLHIRSDDQQEELWINDDATNPIITRMNLGWSIELKSVQ
jgi:hypothetical protein